MSERVHLEQAIAVLEAQRETLGSAVVDISIAAMRDRLAAIDAPRPAEQRKLVTILFADIVGWTAISEQLDPEDLRQLQHAYFSTVTPIIASYGGAVEKYIGDAVLAVFGVPTAHEDDAKRAVLAALAIQQVMANLNRQGTLATYHDQSGADGQPTYLNWSAARPAQPIALRIGIHTGLVMASTGNGDHDFLVTGDVVNLAARLQAVAEAETVLVSQETYRLVADDFQARSLPPLALKGVAEPVRAYRIVDIRASRDRTRRTAGPNSPLVGRQAELAVLENAIARLKDGQGSVSLVIGEAGIGKSRLVAEAFNGAAARDVECVTGRCLSYGNAIPYHLWLDVLRNSAKIPTDAPPAVVDAQLRAWIERFCPEDCDDIYLALARLLSLTMAATWPAPDASLADGAYSKPAVFRAIETLVRIRSVAQPLAIICEDLQWADPSSIELLEHLTALTEQVPLLLVCVFRPEVAQPIWTLVGRLSAALHRPHSSLWLQPLSAATSEELISNLLGGELTPQSQKVLRHILSRAEGNPFFLEEAIRSLVQSHALIPANEPGRWLLPAEMDALSIPETVQAVLGARIDRLNAATRRVLQVAAVIGRDFSPTVLASLIPDEPDLAPHLRGLLDLGFITECAAAAGPEYRFTHALVCEVAYNSLLRSERRRYHRRVAESLEEDYRQRDANVEVLALHWQKGGEPARAANYYVQSGDRARRLGSSVEATQFFQTALDLLGGVKAPAASPGPETLHERLGDVYLENLSAQDQALVHYTAFLAGANSPLDRARGARKLASIYVLQGDLAEARAHFEAALAGLAGLPPTPEANRAHCGLAYLFISQADLEQAGIHVRQSIRLARSIGDVRGLADAYRIRGIIADRQGNPRLALAYAHRCLKLYGDLHDLPQLVQANNNAADSCRQLGLLDRANQYLATGLELAQRIGVTRDQALLLVTQAELLLDQGRSDEAIGRLLEALPLAQSSGAVTRVLQAHHILGEALEHQGRLEEASKHLQTALALCVETRHHRFKADILLALAHLAATRGDFASSQEFLYQAAVAGGPDPIVSLAREHLRVRAFLALRREQWCNAVGLLEESLLPSDTREPTPQRAHAHFLLAQAYAGRRADGDLALARRHLKAARAAYRRIGAETYLAAVESTLSSLAPGSFRS